MRALLHQNLQRMIKYQTEHLDSNSTSVWWMHSCCCHHCSEVTLMASQGCGESKWNPGTALGIRATFNVSSKPFFILTLDVLPWPLEKMSETHLQRERKWKAAVLSYSKKWKESEITSRQVIWWHVSMHWSLGGWQPRLTLVCISAFSSESKL